MFVDSIIMWRDRLPTGDEDYAVSFQNTGDCQAIWDAIGDVQSQYLQHNEYGLQPTFNKTSPSLQGIVTHQGNGYFASTQAQAPSSSSSHRLPAVSRQALQEIKFIIVNTTPFDKDSTIARLSARDFEYLRQLLDLFMEMEAMADVVGLNIMSEIWRAVLMLNESTLIQFALSVSQTPLLLSMIVICTVLTSSLCNRMYFLL